MRAYKGSLALLAAIVIVFGFEMAAGVVADDAGLIRLGALPDTLRLHCEYWRLMSFGFLHWNATHLLLNTGLLFAAGPIAERRTGTLRLLAVFMAASVMSGAGILVKHLFVSAPGASVGASGGMFGLLGLALVLESLDPRPRPGVRYGLVALAAGAFLYSVLPGISMVGHFVGFTVGAGVGFAISPLRPRR